jgi:hypothetical protein
MIDPAKAWPDIVILARPDVAILARLTKIMQRHV